MRGYSGDDLNADMLWFFAAIAVISLPFVVIVLANLAAR